MSELQWIVHFQSLHFLKYTFVKEFCAVCIQTREVMHVNMVGLDAAYLTGPELVVFHTQMNKHGLTFQAGEITSAEFFKYLNQYLAKTCDMYVLNTHIKKWLIKAGYDADSITILPQQTRWSQLNKCPRERCPAHTDMLSYTCARQMCNEIYNYIKPAFIPYFD